MSADQTLQTSMTIGTHIVRRLDDVRTLLVDNKALKFTPTEYRLLLRLLEGNPVSDQELIAILFKNWADHDFWARETLSRHLENVRRKLRKRHVKLSIRRISAFGYILLPDGPLRNR